jgi:hypothetical protein
MSVTFAADDDGAEERWSAICEGCGDAGARLAGEQAALDWADDHDCSGQVGWSR